MLGQRHTVPNSQLLIAVDCKNEVLILHQSNMSKIVSFLGRKHYAKFLFGCFVVELLPCILDHH